MLTCKDATRLMSQKMDGKLTPMNRLALGFHLLICRGCRNFDAQIRFIRKAVKHVAGGADATEADRQER